MKKLGVLLILIFTFWSLNYILADSNLAEKLSGRILLQVQSHGEAWYVNPVDLKKYYLGRPADAFALMREFGQGISNDNLNKIAIGLIDYDDQDDDKDGLTNRLENALGTDVDNPDTDGDGYNDLLEIKNSYDPLSSGNSLLLDSQFAKSKSGDIFLQIQNHGEAWYINPTDNKRYFLGRPSDAFAVMRQLSLGATNQNINQIKTGDINNFIDKAQIGETSITNQETNSSSQCDSCNSNDVNTADSVISGAAAAIRANDKTRAASYFIPQMKKAIDYTLDFLDADGRLTLGNIISGAKLSASTANKKTYSTEVYFSLGGYKVTVNFYVEKQVDGSWLMTNL